MMQTNPDAADRFERLLNHPTAVVISGPIGAGKSFAAEAVANAVIGAGHPVAWISEVGTPENVTGPLLNVIHGVAASNWPAFIAKTGARLVVIDSIEHYIPGITGIDADEPTTDQVLAFCRRLAEETGTRVVATFATFGSPAN